ncbi:MAG TPA: portal protein [Steroidobacteraceae bacterium]|nr:portal protein [Steroidobacteraceae bacterium]
MASEYGAEGLAKRSRYDSLLAALKSERSSFDPLWRDLGDWIFPRRYRFQPSDRNRSAGRKQDQKILDSTARFSVRTLQSGLHAGLTSPARPWMRLTTPNQDLAEQQPVKEWLHVVTQRMLTVFQQTNLYNTLPIVYGDMGVFGTAAMSVVDDTKDLFRCYAYPVGSYVLGLDARNLVTTFAREYQLTVRQVVEQFGVVRPTSRDIDWSMLSTTVKSLWDRGQYEAAVDVTWIITPNEQADPQKLAAKYLPFSSCYYETGSTEQKYLRESGFRTFPIMAPRWDVTGEDTYGTDSPGITALADVKQLQHEQAMKAKAINKMVDPPVMAPTVLKTQTTGLHAGEITYVDVREGMAGMRSVYDLRINLADMSADIQSVQYRIQRAFYEDLFLMLARSDQMRGAQPLTAREVEERHEEKLLALGPVLERTNDELLEPLIDRVYAMMDEAGFIPDPPPQIQGKQLKVEYTSIMAQAQKLVSVVGQDRFSMTVQPLTQLYPEAKYKLDVFQLVDNYGEMLGVDPRIIVPSDEAKQAMAADQQQAAAAQQAQQMALGAKAMKDASQADLSGDNALNRMVDAATAGGGVAPPAGQATPV